MKCRYQDRPLCPFALVLVASVLVVSSALAKDMRNFANGHVIPDEGYCDQPYIVVTKDGNWLCTLTTGKGHEGQRGQHVAAAISSDRGRTWSPLIDIEPADGPEASWVVPLVTPGGRVYAFYNYNGDKVGHGSADFAMPDGRTKYRADTVGWYCYRYSDDHGRTWSERSRLPMPVAACDRGNQWQGRVQVFWGIDKPKAADGTAFFAFTRLGRWMLEIGEGWLYRSENLLSETDVANVRWELLPTAERGIRAEEFGSVQEEHNIVPLGGNRLYCVYRTTHGFSCHSYSEDGGRTWSKPEPMTYTPGGRRMRNPRGCPKLWNPSDGRYLFWYHNNGEKSYNVGDRYGFRNVAWLCGGRLVDGRLHWSEPEIVRYCDHPFRGCSYPDLIAHDGGYFLAATQKTEARVTEVDRRLVEDLWRQHTLTEVAQSGLVLSLGKEQFKSRKAAMPRLPSLADGGGFAIELWLKLPHLRAGRVVLDSHDPAAGGLVVRTTVAGALRLDMSDGVASTGWDCDPGLLQPGKQHHVVFIVDGGPKVVSVVVDGRLCDGGDSDHRRYGWGRFRQSLYLSLSSDTNLPAHEIGDVSGGKTLRLDGSVVGVRIYDRYLRTSEAVSNYRAGPAK